MRQRSYHSGVRLILASASPRRAELLRLAGYTFDVRTADIDESVRPGERPHDYVRRLALEKGAAVARALASEEEAVSGAVGHPDSRTNRGDADVLIVAADTSVIVDDEILGKPVDAADSERMLRLLSGRSHLVLTGVSVRSRTSEAGVVVETAVFVQELSEADMAWYVASGEGVDKAGAYAIQGLASRFIPRIEGSYANVVGLPVAEVARLIDERVTK